MKIIVDKTTAVKAVCEMLNIPIISTRGYIPLSARGHAANGSSILPGEGHTLEFDFSGGEEVKLEGEPIEAEDTGGLTFPFTILNLDHNMDGVVTLVLKVDPVHVNTAINDKDSYYNFVELLKERMAEGKLTEVTIK